MTQTEKLTWKKRLLHAAGYVFLGGAAFAGTMIGHQHEDDAVQELQDEIRELRRDLGSFSEIKIGKFVFGANIGSEHPDANDPRLAQIDTLEEDTAPHKTRREWYGMSAVVAFVGTLAGTTQALVQRGPEAQVNGHSA